jgi:hypothetical protein
MYVFELDQPGTWLDSLNDESRHDAQSLLQLLNTCIQDAAIALSMFEESQGALRASDHSERTWETDAMRERVVEERLESSLPPGLSPHDHFLALDRVRELARLEVKREKWRDGHIPSAYLHRMPFLHAKTYVYALDILHKALAKLSSIPEVPSAVADVLRDYEAAFPNLLDVRDSSHHAEDRVQGKRRQTRIELKPVVNDVISAATGGVLFVDILNGSRYGGTLADGSFGEVDVSPESLALAQACVQGVFNAFRWRGPAMHLPW